MKKQVNLYAGISLMLILLLVFGLLPITGIAQNDSTSKVIESFDVSEIEVSVPVGTAKENISFPETLSGILVEGETAEIPIAWKDGGIYDQDTPGTYTFTADIGTYLYGQARPVAVVTVTEASYDPTGSISGRLWLDENADGVMDESETGIEDYPVSLYRADDLLHAVETSTTVTNGAYSFENIGQGSYVVGIAPEIVGGVEYQLPLAGISGDNKFEIAVLDEDTVMAYSETILVSQADTSVQSLNAGIRLMSVKRMAAIWNAATYGQLKAYVASAQENDIIIISGNIDFPQSESITINKSITFSSGSESQVILAHPSAGRHFLIAPGKNGSDIELNFENIVFDGKKKGGGFEVNTGVTLHVNLINSVIQNCNAENGGSFLVRTGASLGLQGGEISGNAASKDGGGICVNSGSLTVSGTEISGNTAARFGAGIAVDKSNASILDCKICNNETITSSYNNRNGGGIYGSESQISVTDSEISKNEATGGGGIFLSIGMLSIDHSQIFNNKVTMTGGGIFIGALSGNVTNTITDSEIYGNEADLGGGGLSVEGYTTHEQKNSNVISGCRLFDNKSVTFGGAIMTSGGDVTVVDSNIFNNTSGYGGAAYLYNSSAFTISGGGITGNAALASFGTYGGGQGGGIHLRANSVVTVKDGAEISSNVAESVESNSGCGGGIYLYQSRLIVENGEIIANMAKRNGGGIYSEKNGIVTMEAGNIAGNVAPNGGGIYTDSLANLTVTSDEVVFNDNIAGKANAKSDVNMGLHAQKIFTTHFTVPFDFAYNNFDVGYKTTATGVFYTVEFDSRGGSLVHPRIAAPGSTIFAPSPDPTRPGFIFAGWYQNTSGTIPWNFTTDTVTGNMTLYAKWVQSSSVTVSKTVAGSYGDKNKEFYFTIRLFDENGNQLPKGRQFQYTGSIISGSGAKAPAGGTLTLDSDGEAEFTLKHGQQMTVTGIVINSKVQIAENSTPGYTTSYKDSNETHAGTDTGICTLTGTAKTFAYTNTRTEVVPTGISAENSKFLVFLALPMLLAAGAGTGRIFRRYKGSF